MGVESLIRSLHTPTTAMELGDRAFRVELKDGDPLDGVRATEFVAEGRVTSWWFKNDP
jgi:hypothetical protein